MTLHPDAIRKNLFEEHEYPGSDLALSKMYEAQKLLQTFVGKKYNHKCDFSNIDKESMTLVSQHYAFAGLELFEELKKAILREDDRKEIAFELIDVTCFVFNMLIYAGISNLDKYRFELNEIEKFTIANQLRTYSESTAFSVFATDLFSHLSDFVQALPYKPWKYYDSYNYNIDKIKPYVASVLKSISKLAHMLRVTEEDFYSYYMCKNKENFDRQLDSSKGYVNE